MHRIVLLLLMPLLVNSLCAQQEVFLQDSLFLDRVEQSIPPDKDLRSAPLSAPPLQMIKNYLEERPREDPNQYSVALQSHLAYGYFNAKKYSTALEAIKNSADFYRQNEAGFYEQLANCYVLRAKIESALSNNLQGRYWNGAALDIYRRHLDDLSGQGRKMYQSALVTGATLNMFVSDTKIGHLLLDELLDMDATELSLESRIREEMLRVGMDHFSANYPAAAVGYRAFLEKYPPNIGPPQLQLEVINMMNNLGLCYLKNKEYEKAEHSLQQAIEVIEANTDLEPARLERVIEKINLNLVSIYGKKGESDKITANLESTLPSIGPQEVDRLSMLYTISTTAYLDAGNLSAAAELIDSSSKVSLHEVNLHGPAQIPTLYGNVLHNFRNVGAMMSSRQDYFIKAYEKGLDDEGLEKAILVFYSIDSLVRITGDEMSLTSSMNTFYRQYYEMYETAISLAQRIEQSKGDQGELKKVWSYVAAQKSNLLREQINSEDLANTLGVPPSLLERRSVLAQQLIKKEEELANLSLAASKAMRDSTLRIHKEIQEVHKEIATNYPEFEQAIGGGEYLDFDKIASQVSSDQAILEYFVGPDTIYTFVITRGNDLKLTKLAKSKELTEQFKLVSTDTKAAKKVYELLVAPALRLLPDGIERLAIIRDGETWNIPFAALQKGGEFLIRNYAISYAYSTNLLFDAKLREDVKQTKMKLAGFGLSYEDIIKKLRKTNTRSSTDRDLLNLSSLPFVREEMETIAEITKGDIWLDEAATKTTFLELIPNYQQFHLAMHGLADPAIALENALVFAAKDPGKKYDLLTTREILAQKIPARLAVLSACHTGAGPLENSEGVQSMARAFTFAGVKSTVASNWAASDEVTARIITRFYEEIEKGQLLDRAMQIATLAYLDEATPANRRPEVWANLELTGFTDPIESGWNRSTIYGFVSGLLFMTLLIFYGWWREKRKQKHENGYSESGRH